MLNGHLSSFTCSFIGRTIRNIVFFDFQWFAKSSLPGTRSITRGRYVVGFSNLLIWFIVRRMSSSSSLLFFPFSFLEELFIKLKRLLYIAFRILSIGKKKKKVASSYVFAFIFSFCVVNGIHAEGEKKFMSLN